MTQTHLQSRLFLAGSLPQSPTHTSITIIITTTHLHLSFHRVGLGERIAAASPTMEDLLKESRGVKAGESPRRKVDHNLCVRRSVFIQCQCNLFYRAVHSHYSKRIVQWLVILRSALIIEQ